MIATWLIWANMVQSNLPLTDGPDPSSPRPARPGRAADRGGAGAGLPDEADPPHRLVPRGLERYPGTRLRAPRESRPAGRGRERRWRERRDRDDAPGEVRPGRPYHRGGRDHQPRRQPAPQPQAALR